MSMRRDVLANYLGVAAQVLAPLLALPWYLAALGGPAYGLLSFVVLLQTVLAMADAGISQALVREFSIRSDATAAGRQGAASLLYRLQPLYWGGALMLGGLMAPLAPWIASHWIRLGDLAPQAGVQAVYFATAIFAVQLPGSLYRSVLIGCGRQAVFQYSLVGWTVLRHGVGVALVLIWSQLWVYLLWHAVSSLAETLTRRQLALAKLRGPATALPEGELQRVARAALGMGGAVFLGALTVHVDKVLLSRMVSLEAFGHYAIAATLAIGALQAVNPLTMAVLPRAVHVRGDAGALRRLSWRLLAMNGGVVLLGALLYLAAGERLLVWWLRDRTVVAAIMPVLSVSLWGTALNALYNIGYVNWLAHGRTRHILAVNGLALLVALLSVPPLVMRWGLVGAAAGWVAMNMIGFVLSLGWLRVPRPGGKEQ